MPGNYAYVTVITKRSYLPGVWVLKETLREVNSQYPLVVLVPSDAADEFPEIAKWEGIRVITRDRIILPEVLRNPEHCAWDESFFKLRAAGLEEFDKIVLIDCDVLVLRNLDHMFQMKHMSAVEAGRSIFKDWIGLASGVMVIEPGAEVEKRILDCMEPAILKRFAAGKFAGDQDVLREYCPDWQEREELHLPEAYNLIWNWAGKFCNEFVDGGYKKVYVLHFAGGMPKPWDCGPKEVARMTYHGIRDRNLAELKAYMKYLKIVRKMER